MVGELYDSPVFVWSPWDTGTVSVVPTLCRWDIWMSHMTAVSKPSPVKVSLFSLTGLNLHSNESKSDLFFSGLLWVIVSVRFIIIHCFIPPFRDLLTTAHTQVCTVIRLSLSRFVSLQKSRPQLSQPSLFVFSFRLLQLCHCPCWKTLNTSLFSLSFYSWFSVRFIFKYFPLQSSCFSSFDFQFKTDVWLVFLFALLRLVLLFS